MTQLQLSQKATILAMNAMAEAQDNTIKVEIVSQTNLEGMHAITTLAFIPEFVGIILKDGEVERSTEGTNFDGTESKCIVVEMNRPNKPLGKNIIKTIFSNQAPVLYNQLVEAGKVMQSPENEGVFPKFTHTGAELLVAKITHERAFYIPNKRTDSGWTEDAQKRPMSFNDKTLAFFHEFEDLQTEMRRQARQMETRGEYVGSEAPINIGNKNNAAPIPTPEQIKLYKIWKDSGAPQIEDPNNQGYDKYAHPMVKKST